MTQFEINRRYIYLRDLIIKNYFNNLNEEQKNAVLSDREAVLVAACPGAGKTHVIVNRIVYLTVFGYVYESDNVPEGIQKKDLDELNEYLNFNDALKKMKIPKCLTYNCVSVDNIMVITFTKMAAKSMKDRYIKISGNKKSPFFGTFHSLFYRVLSRYYSEISIISEAEIYRVIREVLDGYLDFVQENEVRSVVNDISHYKNNKLLNLGYETKTDNKVFMECIKAYEDYKLHNKLMDFDDIIINCIKLFEKNSNILNSYRRLFKNILVDEFQDCDSEQIYLLKLLSNENKVFAVGDEDQCIYGFRGSRPDCMVDFCKHFNFGVKYFLNNNYRSKSNIVKISRNVICKNKYRNDKNMIAVRKDLGLINFMYFKTEKEQADKIADLILSIKNENKCLLNEIAILYRTNNESQKIIGSLMKNKIKFNILDKKYNFFRINVCRDIISYLRLSLDVYDRESFIRIINKPYRYISKTKIEKVKCFKFSRNCFKLLMEFPDIPVYQMKKIHDLEKNVVKLGLLSPNKAIDSILNKIGYAENVKSYSQDIVKELKDISSDFKTVHEFLIFVDEYNREMNKNMDCEQGIILSTIHGVKGLEYKNIFIVNCNKDNMPHLNSLSNIEEERRLFYVGITRAIDNLWITYSEIFQGNQSEKSPFIDECSM